MKRILIYLLLVWVAFAACRKEDDPVFPETADERINKTLAAYQTALAGSPNGWNGELTTANGVVYKFHFSFSDANRVQMFSDFDRSTASVRKESSYRLKALQQPALLFDTYSYIHLLADPADSVAGGPAGEGLSSDFEFALDTLTADSIKLTGRFQKTKMVLRKASAQDLAAWQNGQWANAVYFSQINDRILNYFKRLATPGRQYELSIDPIYRTVTFTWRDAGGVPHSHTTEYYYTAAGVQLARPLTDGTTTITSLSNFTFNATTSVFTVTVNTNTAGAIGGVAAPLVVDTNAARRWWQRATGATSYWRSFYGFHVNGVDDAYGLRKIPNFYFLAFLAQFDQFNNIIYDLAGYIYLENNSLSLYFGTALQPPTFTADGRIVFPYLGDLGDIPPDAEEAYINTAVKLIDPLGFWIVQTGPNSYDMVSARDGKSWITWQ
ncbi:DUF4302 domain-containing protein [Chitinophaga lutea]